MKKCLAIILAAAMLAACSVTVFADSTDVSYNVDPAYTVEIPASVTLGNAEVAADITASDVILETGKQVEVKLTEASNTESGSSFSAKNGESVVTYTITGDAAIAVGDTVATFTENGTKTLTFSAADKTGATIAGSHTETLTFTISVEDAVKTLTVGSITFEYKPGDTWQTMIDSGKYDLQLDNTLIFCSGSILCHDSEDIEYAVVPSDPIEKYSNYLLAVVY